MIVTRVDPRIAPEALQYVAAGVDMQNMLGIIAYCSVYLDDCFVIREVRVVGGASGLKVSMPDRKLSIRLPCGHKNDFDNDFCCRCGAPKAPGVGPDLDARRHLDMCHPVTQECRRHINELVIGAVRAALDGLRPQSSSE